MKFSHSIQFNAVPEWSSKYISYTTLKKLIYSLQRESLHRRKSDSESAYLISNDLSQDNSPSEVFKAALDAELSKIDEFYKKQEEFIFISIEDLLRDIEYFKSDVDAMWMRRRPNRKRHTSKVSASSGYDVSNGEAYSDAHLASQTNLDTDGNYTNEDNLDAEESNDDDELQITSFPEDEGAGRRRKSSVDGPYYPTTSRDGMMSDFGQELNSQINIFSESRILLRKRVIGLFTTLSELKSYIELNNTGFKKALKKFDKSLGTTLKDQYLVELPNRSYIFKKSTLESVNNRLDDLIRGYALVCNHGDDLEQAKSELSIHLREHVVWERNTVWRDLIGIERKKQSALAQDSSMTLDEKKGANTSSLTSSIRRSAIIKLTVITSTSIFLLVVSPFEEVEQRNCFALLVCASLLWATESLPLFVTSLLIPLLIVILGVLKNDDGSRMQTVDSSKYILASMWNSVILLLLGGFTLAASLTKYHIAKLMSTWVLSKAGTNPSVVLLTVMSIALFASMWVSNVAAPVLCLSLIQPLLRTLPKGSAFARALILGIALASNIGGMASPIASPQNMIAIGAMDPQPSWGQWFVISMPICILSLAMIWMFLLLTFSCNSRNTHLVAIRTIDDKFSGVQLYIVIVSATTIFLWCIASRLEGIFGEMGIIALIPLILFFGPGLLTTEDFNNYPWNIVVLAMGGTALGKAVASSGLLETIALSIQKEVEDFSLFGVVLSFGLLILTVATFVSHTVAALIVIPLVSEIGSKLDDPHPRLLIMASALLCSAAMGLPTSGFPNVTAICMTDDLGNAYLNVGTFITRGVPSSFMTYLIIISIGYATMKLIDF
ncbi:hypothetical protein CJI97_000494 [Candidozyma auris]|nr:hypothetical protein CJI97_000494 [[Candida] auris]